MERNPTILIVDDDPQIRRLQGLALERAGYHVIQAASGSEALQKARQKRPDLILLDVVLPDIEGPDICRRIKADPDLAGTHVVLISGKRTEPDDQVEGLESGADGSIMRPIAPRELLARVEARLRTQQAERELRAAEARYRAVFETASVGIYRAAPDWEIVMANPALGHMLGCEDPDALTGKNLDADIRGPDYPREAFEQQMAEDNQVTSLEAVWTRTDGEALFVQETVRPIRDDSGRLVAYQGSVDDVTHRVLRTRRTQRHHAVLSAVRNIKQLIVRQEDPTRLIAGACEHLADIDGYDTVWITIQGDDEQAPRVVSAGRESTPPSILDAPVRAPSDPLEREGRPGDRAWCIPELEMLQTADGCPRRRLVEAAISHAGKAYGLLVISTPPDLDVHAMEEALLHEVADDIAFALHGVEHQRLHRRADEALQRSESRYRLLAETARDVIVTHDLKGNITYVNQSAVDLMGYTREELLSMSVADVLPPHERAAMAERARQRADGNDVPYLYQIAVVDAGGERKPLEVSSAAIRQDGQNDEILLAARDLTERRRAQEALRESEERYRTLFEASPESIALIGLDGTLLDCNPATAALAGRSREELLGKPFSQLGLLPSGRLDEYTGIFTRLLEGEPVEPVEIRGTRHDGETYWAEAFPAPMMKNGQVEAIQVITRDITDRKRAEQQLRNRERLLAKSQEMANVGSWSLDPRTGEVTWSDQAYHILGHQPGETAPTFELLMERVHPDDKSRVARTFLEAQHEGKAYGLIHRIVLPDGATRVLHAESECVTDADGDPVAWYGIVHDITERRRAQKALRESEERYRTLFESSIDGIAQSDLDGNIVDCNQAYLDLTGHTLEEMKGLSYQELTPQEWAQVDAAAVQQALERGYSDLYEKERIRKDGTVFPISIRIWTVEDDDGEAVGLWGIVRDISQRKEAEAEATRKEERLQSLFDITQYDAEDVQDLLDYALNQAVELTDSDVGYIYHYHEDRQQFILNTWSEEVMDECRVAERETVYDLAKTGIWGEAVRQRRRILINDFQAPHSLKGAFPEGHVELNNFLTVPIFSGDSIVAVVGVGNKPADYNDSDVRELTLLMDSVWKVVERRRAEEALAESERQLATLLGNLRGMAYRCQNDPDWTVEFVSEGSRPLTGYDPDDLIDNATLAYADLILPDDRQRVWNTIQDALGRGDPFQLTYRIRSADGSVKWVWEQGRGVLDEDGEVLALEGFITDITEQRRVEEALRESEERYRTLFESSPEAVFLLSPEGLVLDCNPAAESLAGPPREELIGGPFTVLSGQPERAFALHADLLSRLREGQQVEAAELRVSRQDGRDQWVEVFAAPILEGGHVASIQLIVQDITDRKEAQEALRESEERYRSVFEEIPAGLYRTRPNGEVIDANPALVELLHYPDQETFLGINARDLYARPEGRADRFGEIGPDGEWKRVTHELRRGDGEVIWVADTGRTVTDAEGNVLYYSGVLEDITDFKKAQEALRESEARNRAILDALPDLLFVVREDGVFLDYYATSNKGLYLPGEAFLGQRIQDIFPPGTGERLHRRIEQAVDTGEMQVDEYELLMDGQVRYFETRIVPHGERATLSVIREITDRRRAEQRTARLLEHQVAVNDLALELSETRDLHGLYQAMYDHVREITDTWGFLVSSYDGGSNLIQAEYAVFKESQVDVSNFPPLTLADTGRGTQSRVIHTGEPFYAPDYRDAVATSSREYSYEPNGTLHEGPPPEHDDDVTRSALYVPMKLEGKTVGVMQLHSPRPDAYSEQVRDTLTTIANLAAVAGQNVQLLGRTREQARRLQQTIDSVPEGMLLLDGDHRVVLSNPVARLDLEVLAEAGVGDIVRQLGDVPIEELLTSPPSDRAWHEIQADGRTFEVIGRPISSGAQGESWVVVINDVTAERQVEQQLHQQERLAAVGQLAGGIAHDFNNILASIMLYAEMGLGSKGLTAETDEALHTILEESHRAADLVQQILDFSRSAMMETKLLDLPSMVQDTAALLRRTLPESIRLRTELVSGPVVVDADPTRIHQALMNLALNAKDAMPNGGHLRITVDRTTIEEPASPPIPGMPAGTWATLGVSDTGTGMSADAQEHLFEPFFTTKGPDKGTGLGLAQVYGIVKQHEGFIDVQTAEDEGTTFTIYLPLAEPEEAEPPDRPEVGPLPGQGETILVVEDAPQLRGALQVGLESMGYHVIPASHGRQALDLLAEQEVNLVLTDVVMPEMGGKALLNHLRAEQPHLKIIAMTGHVVDTDVQGLREAGFNDALPKPFSIEQLTQIVRDVLDR